MQTSISSVFKPKKRNSLQSNQDKEKSKINSKDNNQLNCNKEKNNPISVNRRKRKNRSNESFEIPETKVNNKKAKIEDSLLNSFDVKNIESSSQPEIIKNKITENFSKSSVKTSASNEDTFYEISSKTKNIIENILNKRNEENNIKNLEEVNYLNINNFINIPANLPKINKQQNIIPDIKKEIKLSEKTVQIMNQLKKEKTERTNRFKRNTIKERCRSNSSFSLKFKYEDLIKEERELILPPQYKALLNMQSYLDNTLNALKLRKDKIPFIDEIKKSIEINYKHKFDLSIFQQILYIVPHLYIYQWERINENEYNLIIDFPKDYKERIYQNYDENFDFIEIQTNSVNCINPINIKDLEERKTIMKNVLYEYTNQNHKEFLIRIGCEKDFDPFKFKTWHHDFSLIDDNPKIPIFEIMEKPSVKITTIQDFIKDNEINNNLIKKALENYNSAEEDTLMSQESYLSNSSKNSNNFLSKYISKELINKIKIKEEVTNIEKDINDYNNCLIVKKNNQNILREICDKVKTIMMQHIGSIKLTDLISKIMQNSTYISSAYTIDNIRKILFILKDNFPNWLKIIDHSSEGTIVILNKQTQMSEIMKGLEKIDI